MQFNDTSTRNGLIQECERICLVGSGGIANNPILLKDFTARINMGLDRFFTIALSKDGDWQFDDFNYTDFPFATTNLNSGQRDYGFDIDFLTVSKVLVKNEAGEWSELTEVDEPDKDSRGVWLLPGNSGVPTKFDIVGNSILLDPIPNYNSTAGLKGSFKRNASKFVSTDTTKVPGIPSLFHGYLSRFASLPYLLENSIANANNIAALIEKDEKNITDWLGTRSKVRLKRMRPNHESNQ